MDTRLLASERERFWGPSSPNPWTNRSFVGPPNRRPIDGTSQRRKKQQQGPAINAWENEGGRTATSVDGSVARRR